MYRILIAVFLLWNSIVATGFVKSLYTGTCIKENDIYYKFK